METEELCADKAAKADYESIDEELFQRCGTKLSKEKVEKIKDEFKESIRNKRPVLGTPEIGTVVNGYKIECYLGSGGFGIVCLASKNDLFFAIKFMLIKKKQRGPDKEFKILYDLLKSKEHENFLTAYEWGKWKIWSDFDNDEEPKKMLKSMEKKICYMVMKLAGPSLQMLLEEKINLKKRVAADRDIPIMQKALKALKLFHDLDHVHHDIKLDNFAIDITNDDRVLLLDYGMGNRAPHVEEVEKSFKGTRSYASRRALDNKAQSYRDDYECWFNCLYRFQYGHFPWGFGPELEEKTNFWSKPSVQPLQWNQIMTHINLLDFSQKMNFDFVQQCLQDYMDKAAGIPLVPYLYARTDKNGKAIVHGQQRFGAEKDDKKGRKRFICRVPSCNYTIFVVSEDCQKAEEGTEAVIVDTLNHHTCTSTTT